MAMQTFSAIVLAGDRTSQDPLLSHANVGCKAAVMLNGEPLLLRVVHALQQSQSVATIGVSGPTQQQLNRLPAINALVTENKIHWAPPELTPSKSAWQALQQLPVEHAALLTTTDHAFPTDEIVDYFCRHSAATDADVVVGLVPYSLVQKAFPTVKKTVLRFKDGAFCSCNLFAMMTPQGRKVADLWRQVEQQRKSPIKIIKLLGWSAVIRYALGMLTLPDALQRLSKRWQLQLAVVQLPFANAAIDIDSVADYETVKSYL